MNSDDVMCKDDEFMGWGLYLHKRSMCQGVCQGRFNAKVYLMIKLCFLLVIIVCFSYLISVDKAGGGGGVGAPPADRQPRIHSTTIDCKDVPELTQVAKLTTATHSVSIEIRLETRTRPTNLLSRPISAICRPHHKHCLCVIVGHFGVLFTFVLV